MKLRFKQENKTIKQKVSPVNPQLNKLVYGESTYYREYTESGPKVLQYFCEENQEWCDVPLEIVEVSE
jgi:hypothetical protein